MDAPITRTPRRCYRDMAIVFSPMFGIQARGVQVIETADLVGAKLGTYEIQALLGSGGMASVYLGFDVNLRREVAIKVLSETAAAQPGLAARFRQEAQIIAGLHHPHIVKIYDLGEQDGLTYMVQELLPGSTLEA